MRGYFPIGRCIDQVIEQVDYKEKAYMRPELEMPKNTEWQEQISHNSMPDAFRSLRWSLQGRIVKESSNITKYSPESRDLWWSLCDLFGVFDKTDAQLWNESHIHYCYVTMRSICCHGDKSLVSESRAVIGEWSAYP